MRPIAALVPHCDIIMGLPAYGVISAPNRYIRMHRLLEWHDVDRNSQHRQVLTSHDHRLKNGGAFAAK